MTHFVNRYDITALYVRPSCAEEAVPGAGSELACEACVRTFFFQRLVDFCARAFRFWDTDENLFPVQEMASMRRFNNAVDV